MAWQLHKYSEYLNTRSLKFKSTRIPIFGARFTPSYPVIPTMITTIFCSGLSIQAVRPLYTVTGCAARSRNLSHRKIGQGFRKHSGKIANERDYKLRRHMGRCLSKCVFKCIARQTSVERTRFKMRDILNQIDLINLNILENRGPQKRGQQSGRKTAERVAYQFLESIFPFGLLKL